MKKQFIFFILFTFIFSQKILIPMDNTQNNHLKAYGFAFWILKQNDNVDWLLNAYPFKTVADSIDELFIINVSRETIEEYSNRFFLDVEKIMSKVFVPLTLGGGIKNFSHVNSLFENGSDKVVINRMIIENPLLVQQISKRYGSQSIVASIDFKKIVGKKNFKISETATIFRNRVRGESSVNIKLIIDSLIGLLKLYLLKKSSKI